MVIASTSCVQCNRESFKSGRFSCETHKCLSGLPSSLLVELRPTRQADFDETIKEFSAKLSLVPLPPPGQLHVVRKTRHISLPCHPKHRGLYRLCLSIPQSFSLRPLQVVLPSREDQDRPVMDIDLHLPFLLFSHTALLQVILRYLLQFLRPCMCLKTKLSRLLRCFPASFRSRGWCSSPPTGPDSPWLPRVCWCACRSVSRGAVRSNNVCYSLFC